ncbi:Trichothecene 3-O-acetyltransferase [Vanrija pseudolonga]|uniref:Trichothecene 3-O-acetyltransferase n=1 Tax=Vanrija pseudolonga TaxID=143232 RepID=A0AAF1BFI7_9TREE|nr:Trichothecene 3-O-acetyltransferase [Vanrija pseudolonga]
MSKVIITSQVVVQPQAHDHHTFPISITGNSLAMGPPVPPVWFLNGAVDTDVLLKALDTVANAYPHTSYTITDKIPPSAGDAAAAAAHTKRHGRLWAVHDDKSPGILFTAATCDGPIADALPHKLSDSTADASPCSSNLLCTAHKVVRLRPHYVPGHALVAQLTSFDDGAALAVLGTHALFDTHSVLRFVHDWAAVYTALKEGKAAPQIAATPAAFTEVDKHAAGDIDADAEDAGIKARAAELPGRRLDVYASDPKLALPFLVVEPVDGIAPPLEGNPHRMPWETWDWRNNDSVERTVTLSPAAVGKAYELCGEGGKTHLDALLGFIWRANVRARNLAPETEVHFSSTVGVRRRLGLKDWDSGAPVLMASSAASVADLETGAAAAIRKSLDAFTPENVGVALHHMAFASDPVREANYFFGERAMVATSWLGYALYDVKFGSAAPVHVHPAFHAVDGLVLVLPRNSGGHGAEWWKTGASVWLALKANVMERVLAELEGLDTA